MKLTTEHVNGLTCHVADRLEHGTNPDAVVILCHGYGASGTDLVSIGQMLLKHSKLTSVQFLFPEAPLSLEDLGMPDGRAWWPIDMRRLQMAAALGSFRDLRNDNPPHMAVAREMLVGLIRQWSERTGVPLSRFVLGGFSQGSMLATDVTLQLDENPAGLVVLSGTLLNEEVWRVRAAHHKLLRVFQSHGSNDPILPFAAAGWLRDLLNQAGADVEFLPFSGGHEIPLEVLQRVAVFLNEVTAKRSV
ncbi:alpha/beta hydrolase [Schlesneria paludicola]|uniref:alpha/beta hydrolase n=1 Tax=Schlesneria paludicola TaxID=360056 RepID=UPI00029AAA2C|nr:phospholipase/carboxylesterase [Schlesneria paludicola]